VDYIKSETLTEELVFVDNIHMMVLEFDEIKNKNSNYKQINYGRGTNKT
jgi:hypothetical protein